MEIQTWIDKFNDELTLLGRSKKTKECYSSFLKRFLLYFKDRHHPKHISADDIKKYLVTIDSPIQFKQSLATLRFFYGVVVKQLEKLKRIHYRKYNSKLPDIIDKQELIKRITGIKDVRYKAIISLIYETGMRVSECATLKVTDFNKERREIKIRRGKGSKDRIVTYGEGLRQILKPYYERREESVWFFHGENPQNYISTSTIEKRCQKLINVHPHQLRHCFSVHYLEEGGSIYILSRLLGHNNIKTTERYLRLTVSMLSQIPNHLNQLAA